MEINSDTVADKAKQFKDQASQMLGKVDAQKAVGMTNVFMTKVFFFGKMVSALFMFLSILVMVGALLYWVFAGASGLQVPDFGDMKESFEALDRASSDNSGDIKTLKEKNAVRSKYNSDIMKLMEIGKLKQNNFEGIVEILCSVDAGLRSDFVDGAIDYLEDAKKYFEKKNQSFDGEYMLKLYAQSFEEAIADVEHRRLESSKKRTAALIVCGSSLLGLILFLIIPLLLQIEENTRK